MEKQSEFPEIKYDGFFPYNLNADGSVTLAFESEDIAKKFIFAAIDGFKLKAKLESAKEALKRIEIGENLGTVNPHAQWLARECLKKLEG